MVAIGLAWAAGLIHIQAADEHASEYALYAVAFGILASLQFAWGICVYRSRSRFWISAGIVVSLAVTGVWLASRTSGLPIGPQAWVAEPVGTLDALCTVDELVLVLLLLLLRRPPSPGLRFPAALASGLGVILISLSSLTLMLPGHAH